MTSHLESSFAKMNACSWSFSSLENNIHSFTFLDRKEFLPTICKGLGAFIYAMLENEPKVKPDLIRKSFHIIIVNGLEESIKLKNLNPTVNSTLTSKVVKLYLKLLQDTLHADVVLSVEKLVCPSLIHYLTQYASHSETKNSSEASFILECLVSTYIF